jgi:voltage-gated potassium channel
MQRRETAMMFLDKLERLPELSKEELEDISKRVKKFR